MSSWTELTELVRDRAGQRCEYCCMHQALQGATFHIEHVIPQSLRKTNELEGLALACPGCNLHKSDRTQAHDAVAGAVVRLFHPRQDTWADHFSWHEYRIVGLTPIGRATVEALQVNSERHVFIRQAEEHFALFPP